MKDVQRHQTLASRYSLDKLEAMVIRDIARLQEQLAQIEGDLSDTRVATANTYRTMIDDRQKLLGQIQQQTSDFLRESMAQA